MRIGLVVDSACDLPSHYLQEHAISLLPIAVRIGDTTLVDRRDEAATLEFLHAHVAERGHEAQTTPFPVQEIHDLFLQRLVIDYDHVFCMTIARSRSGIYDNATQASYAILNDYRPVRAAAGYDTPFALRVIDTQNLFAAQGVAAVEAVRLRAAGEGPPKIRARLEHLALHTHGYMVPPDLYYLRNRARAKGDRSVSLLSAALGSALDIKPVLHCNRGETGPVAKIKGYEPAVRRLFEHVAARVEAGDLLTPTLCVSYGGELSALRLLPGYEALREACAARGVEWFESVMSLTGMVNVGKGAVVVGFAAEGQKFEG
ncbi:DegV family protein [Vulcaniibacterium tengchongense]|uniref:DegV family protein with EDD domain n=1 Tax=Vulcaniibacterium tengchongense TaxID=1273429 RepID=A0A3N4UYU1_9GAMM|nr:DegV family protein [Vulcaniibacterium tengchongense]RPE75892.1 DegV family protein with EDD domain [Vulcaniibacterium tengchongense]